MEVNKPLKKVVVGSRENSHGWNKCKEYDISKSQLESARITERIAAMSCLLCQEFLAK